MTSGKSRHTPQHIPTLFFRRAGKIVQRAGIYHGTIRTTIHGGKVQYVDTSVRSRPGVLDADRETKNFASATCALYPIQLRMSRLVRRLNLEYGGFDVHIVGGRIKDMLFYTWIRENEEKALRRFMRSRNRTSRVEMKI